MKVIPFYSIFCFIVCFSIGIKSEQKALLIYDGKKFDCADLTLVSCETGESNVKKALLFKNIPIESSSGFRAPATSPFKGNPEDLEDFYKHNLDGVIEIFLLNKVYQQVRDKYPLVNPYLYNQEKVNLYIKEDAVFRNRFGELKRQAALEKDLDFSKYQKLSKDIFKEKALPEKRLKRNFDNFVTNIPQQFITYSCFPRIANKSIAPWFEMDRQNWLIYYHVLSEIKKNKAKYIQALEKKYETQAYIYVSGVTNSDFPKVLKIIDSIVDKKGNIAKRGAYTSNNVLHELGLKKINFVVMKPESKEFISKQYQIPITKIKPRSFLKTNLKGAYIFIPQLTPSSSGNDYGNLEPGKSVYFNDVCKMILHPLAKDVLEKAKISDGFEKPTFKSLTSVSNPFFEYRDDHLPDIMKK